MFNDAQVAPGEVIASEWHNTALSQGNIPCASDELPAVDVHVGMEVYQTDTAEKLVYTNSYLEWTPFWNMPWGVIVDPVVVSTTQVIGAGSGGPIDGATITFTAVANRWYRCSAAVDIDASSVGTIGTLVLKEGATTLQEVDITCQGYQNFFITKTATLSAGNHTWHLEMSAIAGTITTHSDVAPIQLVVEDLGPAGAPPD